MKICTIIGTRPQFIKAVLISRKLAELNDVEEFIVNTNQHYDTNMSEVFFNELEIPVAKYNLKINGMGHGEMTGRMMISMEKIMLTEKPDAVMVYGDCDTTLAGALVAAKLEIKLIHVESGLRSYDRRMPEELNRILVDRISDVLLCPTTDAITNLKEEGIVDGVEGRVVKWTGDLMIELLDINRERAIALNPEKIFGEKLGDYILATIHRASNTNVINLTKIFGTLEKFGKQIVIPIHPRTANIIERQNINIPDNIKIIQPLSYLNMMALVFGSIGVITDSGGLQKEAYAWGRRCATLRETTEWVETLIGGQNTLINPDKLTVDEMVINLNKCFENKSELKFPAIYGNNVAKTMIDIICHKVN